jgi:hypothetical protein
VTRDAVSPELPEVFAPAAPPLAPELPPEVFALRSARPAAPPRSPAGGAGSSGGPATLRPGTIIDKYRIEELLGLGGFAAVYRATHLLPAALAPIVTWMVAPDRADRPGSYRELRDALAEVCGRSPTDLPDAERTARERRIDDR